jgi:replication factor C subunit 2/4
LSDRQKSVVCEKLAVNESRLLDGANEYLQILDLCATMMTQIAKGA